MHFPEYEKILAGQQKPSFKEAKVEDKLKKCKELLKSCVLCQRRCQVNRYETKGYCGADAKMKIFGAHTHMGEEPAVVPSATIFFSGCTLRCCYCQNAPESINPEYGIKWEEKEAVNWIEKRFSEGCKNVNFVGGEPTPYLYNIIKILQNCKADIPVVFNSNGYYSLEADAILKGLVDIYLLDLRYFSDECAKRLSDAKDYVKTLKKNLKSANNDSEILIRMLVLPEHVKCCAKPALEWIREEIGKDANINIMGQYRPCFKAGEHDELLYPLSKKEYSQVITHAENLGLKNYFYQETFLM